MIKLASNLYQFISRRFLNNSYLIVDGSNCLVVDPSFNDQEITDFVSKQHLTLRGILLTHGHYDHVGNTFNLAIKHNVRVYIHELEKNIIEHDNFAVELGIQPHIQTDLIDYYQTNSLVVEPFKLDILAQTGHTPGGVSIKYQNYVFSGDSVFYDAIGRTDLKHGNQSDMKKSLIQFLKTYNNQDLILPGHGRTALLGEIKDINPFLK
jgi:glyoxylase-like metal-dependent hydrolase (beta-lactamase superfamily II)